MKTDELKRQLIILGIVGGVFFCFKYLLPYFTPFVIGALLAMMIDPLVDLFEEKFKIPRGLSALVLLALVVSVLIIFLTTAIARLVYELDLLLQTLPQYQVAFGVFMDNVVQWFSEVTSGLPKVLLNALQTGEQSIYTAISNLIKQILGAVQRIPSLFIIGLFSFLAAFFISRDKRVISKAIFRFIPRSWRKQVFEVKEDVFVAFSGFLRAQLILISMTAVMAIIGLTILRIRYAWLIGITAGILDLIPVTGPSGIFVPLAVYLVAIDQIPQAIGVLVVLGLILTVRQLSEPRIVGSNVGLHPLATLIAIYLGFRLFGVSGFILGPLAAVTIKAIFAVFLPEARE